jgi:hypothetical protein
MFAFVAGILEERLARLRQRTGPSVATWLILAFAGGLVLGAVVFRRGHLVTPPQISRAPDTQSSTQPTAHASAASDTSIKPKSPAESPGGVKARDKPHVEASSTGTPPNTPAPAQMSIARTDVAAEPAAKPAKAVPRPIAVKTPRFRGSLAIDSHPRGALVFVDGQRAGSTPIVLNNVVAGSRVVRIESDGYELWSGAARVVANEQTRVTATLQRRTNGIDLALK